jgi:hypothetical protein
MEWRMTRRTLARGVCTVWLAALAFTACGSTPAPSASPASVAAAQSPAATPASSPPPSATPSAEPSSPVDPTIADLTGVKTDPTLAHRLPIAVLIDDNQVARPQSGFNGASIVYQAPADGGETRYMMVFQEGDAAQIGPVRSARIYFVQWASEIGAAIGHYGGDRRSRAYLATYNHQRFIDIDALGAGGHAYHRISSRTAPHNGYTSTKALRAMELKLGGPASIEPAIWRRPFRAPAPRASLPASQHLVVPYRTGRIDYRFDPASDLYRRSVDGKTQVDPADGKAVTTRNVVVMFMSFHTDSHIEPGHARPVVGDIGTGRALVYREGRRIEGTWSKADELAPTHLFDSSGAEIPLVTGRTFFQIVPLDTKVTDGT